MLKAQRLIFITLLSLLGSFNVFSSCTGNTDFSFHRGGMGAADEWCCTYVGNGSDASRTNGTVWVLFSDLWGNPGMY